MSGKELATRGLYMDIFMSVTNLGESKNKNVGITHGGFYDKFSSGSNRSLLH